MICQFVDIAFAARKRRSVIAGNNDECIVEQTALFQVSEHPPNMRIEVFDFEGIVQHIVADIIIVRPARGNMINVSE